LGLVLTGVGLFGSIPLQENRSTALKYLLDVDAGTRSTTPRNYEVKWSGPDGVVLDVSQSGWLGAP
jgi:hypothetical protein